MSTQNPERNVASDSPSTCGSCDSAATPLSPCNDEQVIAPNSTGHSASEHADAQAAHADANADAAAYPVAY